MHAQSIWSTSKQVLHLYLAVILLVSVFSCEAPGSLPIGSTGIYTFDVDNSSDDAGIDMELLPDGKVLVAGQSSHGNNYSFFVMRFNPNCSIDTTFGVNGRAFENFSSNHSFFKSMMVQPDGKIVLTGYVYNGSIDQVQIVRFNSDGTPDFSFNSGIVTTYLSGVHERVYAAALQQDGKILLTGTTYNSYDDVLLARINTNGSFDNSFGTSGIVSANIIGSNEYGSGISIQSDGRIVLAVGDNMKDTVAIVRFSSNGDLDTSFGDNGKTYVHFSNAGHNAASLAIQADGKPIMAGNIADDDPFLIRFYPDGTIDDDFMLHVNPFLNSTSIKRMYHIILQTDGKILVTGNDDQDLMVARFNQDGSVDGGFGVNGLASFGDLNHNHQMETSDACVLPDGKVMVLGNIYDYTPGAYKQDILLIKLNPNGSLVQ